MKKIQIDPAELSQLQNLIGMGAPGVKVLKKILDHYISELRDVRNIDASGNMGLQALAAKQALSVLDEFRGEVFPSSKPRVTVAVPGQVPEKRPYA